MTRSLNSPSGAASTALFHHLTAESISRLPFCPYVEPFRLTPVFVRSPLVIDQIPPGCIIQLHIGGEACASHPPPSCLAQNSQEHQGVSPWRDSFGPIGLDSAALLALALPSPYELVESPNAEFGILLDSCNLLLPPCVGCQPNVATPSFCHCATFFPFSAPLALGTQFPGSSRVR